MRLMVPVLVHHDTHERYHVQLPPPWRDPFQSRSLAEALDDAALHLMEILPKAPLSAVESLIRAPNLSHRKVRVTANLKVNERKTEPWTGRLSVWVERWPKDAISIITIPRLGGQRFPVMGLSDLPDAVAAFLADTYVSAQSATLDAAVCQPDEHLEILEIEAEVPTVLPSRRPKKKRKKRKKKDAAKEKKDKKKTYVPPTTLRSVGHNLAHAAIDGRLLPAFGREALIETLLTELARPGAAVLLVGTSGVGKSALVHEVVRRLVDPDAPLTERTDVWEVDGNRIVAGMSMVGQWESRVEDMVTELAAREDILYVDDLPTLVYTGRSAKSDSNVAGFLEPHLAHGELRIIGETTPERLAACREEAPGFFNRFRMLHVDELPTRETLMVLLRALRALETRRNLNLRPDSLRAVQSLARRFHARECEPGASVRLLRGLADLLTSTRTDDAGRTIIQTAEVATAYQRLTGLPNFLLDPASAVPEAKVRDFFHHRVIGQQAAVDAAVDVVCSVQQALDDPGRPVATMLLVGPTGVGKTETAKTLARWLFGDAERMIRFDMSEIRDTAALARFVGDARQPDGELTRRVSSEPFSVVLFDEIEKAHPAVFDLLLQVMGEGRLTNAAGQTADFTNTIVLLTSNLGVAESGKKVGFGDSGGSSQDLHFTKAASTFFRPEFFNRIDRVVPYRALQREHVALLASRLLATLTERRGLRASHVLVRVSPDVVDLLVQEGYDPMYGARALKRTLETRLTVPLARLLATTRVAHTAFLDVFPVARDIEIELADLTVRPAPDLQFGVPDQWDGLRASLDTLRAELVALRQTEDWMRVERRRSELIVEVQRPEGGDRNALSSTNAILTLAAGIDSELDRLEEEVFANYTYEDEWESTSEHRDWEVRRQLMPAWRVEPIDKTRLLHSTVASLTEQKTRFILASWLCARSGSSSERAVLRILGETAEQRTMRGVGDAARALSLAVEGEVTEYQRVDGAWMAHSAADHDTVPDGLALELVGPGARRQAERLQGYIMSHQIVGPDRVTTLVRVELLAESDEAPPAQLQRLDVAWEAWTARRRAGTAHTPSPRPVLPVLASQSADDPPLETVLEALITQVMMEDLA